MSDFATLVDKRALALILAKRGYIADSLIDPLLDQ